MHRWLIVALLGAMLVGGTTLDAQDTTGSGRGSGAGRGGRGGRVGQPRQWLGEMDTVRARVLYVSKDPADLSNCGPNDCEAQTRARVADDSIFAARSKGVLDFQKVHYKSAVDGLEIPADLFAPIDGRARRHAVLVWVHDGIHGHLRPEMYWPFIREAVQRGYVVFAPEYRGSTGYGSDFYRKIDYGGKEVDDVLSSIDYLTALPNVDIEKLGIIGWSHGGFIAAHVLFRGDPRWKAGAAIVPVTNLVFRLSDHGPAYARDYAAEEGIQGLPFERGCGPQHDRACIDEYLDRSPVFHADNLNVPMLVQVATNDCDVFFREDQQMVYTLMALKPTLAETKIYKDPPPGAEGCGHTFSRRVNPQTLEREDSPEQIDAWNHTWAFFEKNLKP
ncbi:MAG: alpha/beta hydrolase family protein [Gemmatimonadales bacterium]